jgi:BlaI family transcriptional regulator, penicillinase repressor
MTKAASPSAIPGPGSPTEAELEILRVLWQQGPVTVRDVHDAIRQTKPVTYTTVLKQMQVMHQKNLLERSERYRSHVYRPRQPQAQVQRRLAQSLLARAFGGSARGLLQSALAGRRVEAAEIEEIRRLLDDLGEKTQ